MRKIKTTNIIYLTLIGAIILKLPHKSLQIANRIDIEIPAGTESNQEVRLMFSSFSLAKKIFVVHSNGNSANTIYFNIVDISSCTSISTCSTYTSKKIYVTDDTGTPIIDNSKKTVFSFANITPAGDYEIIGFKSSKAFFFKWTLDPNLVHESVVQAEKISSVSTGGTLISSNFDVPLKNGYFTDLNNRDLRHFRVGSSNSDELLEYIVKEDGTETAIGFPNSNITPSFPNIKDFSVIDSGKYLLIYLEDNSSNCPPLESSCFVYQPLDSNMAPLAGPPLKFEMDSNKNNANYFHASLTLFSRNLVLVSGFAYDSTVSKRYPRMDLLTYKPGVGLVNLFTEIKYVTNADTGFTRIKPILELPDHFYGLLEHVNASISIRFSALTKNSEGEYDGFIQEGLVDFSEEWINDGNTGELNYLELTTFDFEYDPTLDFIYFTSHSQKPLSLTLFSVFKIGTICHGYPYCHSCTDSQPGSCLKCSSERILIDGYCGCPEISNCQSCPDLDCLICETNYVKILNEAINKVDNCIPEASCGTGSFIDSAGYCLPCSQISQDCLECNHLGCISSIPEPNPQPNTESETSQEGLESIESFEFMVYDLTSDSSDFLSNLFKIKISEIKVTENQFQKIIEENFEISLVPETTKGLIYINTKEELIEAKLFEPSQESSPKININLKQSQVILNSMNKFTLVGTTSNIFDLKNTKGRTEANISKSGENYLRGITLAGVIASYAAFAVTILASVVNANFTALIFKVIQIVLIFDKLRLLNVEIQASKTGELLSILNNLFDRSIITKDDFLKTSKTKFNEISRSKVSVISYRRILDKIFMMLASLVAGLWGKIHLRKFESEKEVGFREIEKKCDWFISLTKISCTMFLSSAIDIFFYCSHQIVHQRIDSLTGSFEYFSSHLLSLVLILYASWFSCSLFSQTQNISLESLELEIKADNLRSNNNQVINIKGKYPPQSVLKNMITRSNDIKFDKEATIRKLKNINTILSQIIVYGISTKKITQLKKWFNLIAIFRILNICITILALQSSPHLQVGILIVIELIYGIFLMVCQIAQGIFESRISFFGSLFESFTLFNFGIFCMLNLTNKGAVMPVYDIFILVLFIATMIIQYTKLCYVILKAIVEMYKKVRRWKKKNHTRKDLNYWINHEVIVVKIKKGRAKFIENHEKESKIFCL